MSNNLLKKIIIAIIFFIVLGIINYFVLIPLNLRYTKVFFLFIIIVISLYFLFGNVLENKSFTVVNKEIVSFVFPSPKVLYVLVGGLVLVTIHALSSNPLIFSKDYQKLIGNVEEKDFISDFEIVKNSQIPIVDLDYAEKLGDKKLGSDRGLGSEYHVGTFSDIIVDGRMVMVAPLEFNGFFKWLNNKSTPGYVIVDKITAEVELVTELNNKKLELKYVDSAYFNSDLKRHVYYNDNMDNELIKTTFELDDNGNPYFVINKIHKTIGINGGDDILSVVIVNAINGEVKEYKPSEAPKWVDTIYPKELVLKQLDDWGYYVNGFWNTIFSEKDIVRVTSDSRRVYNDKFLYHYSGLTSSGSDDSTVGFAFVDTRTKQTTLYKMVGATEEAAMKSAEGKVKNYGYKATFPITVNIANEPTFFITLKDASGLIKQYALVNIEEFSIVGNGETINKAVDSYVKSLNKEYIPDNDSIKEITGKVARIGSDVNEGITTYYIVLEENNVLYYTFSSISKEINVTSIGDKVKISIDNNRIVKFDNLNLK